MGSKQDMEVAQELPSVNVGGTLYTTRLSTLRKDPTSMLAAMFSGRHVIERTNDGRFFIDREGGSFKYILQYLRDGKMPPETESAEVYEEARFQEDLGEYESTRRLRKMTKTVRDSLGEEYKDFLRRFLALIEKSRSEYLQRCFDSCMVDLDNYNYGMAPMYVYDRVKYKTLKILVLGKDQGRCNSCGDIVPIPTSFRNIFEDDLRLHSGRDCVEVDFLPDLCIPSSLPNFVVEKISNSRPQEKRRRSRVCTCTLEMEQLCT